MVRRPRISGRSSPRSVRGGISAALAPPIATRQPVRRWRARRPRRGRASRLHAAPLRLARVRRCSRSRCSWARPWFAPCAVPSPTEPWAQSAAFVATEGICRSRGAGPSSSSAARTARWSALTLARRRRQPCRLVGGAWPHHVVVALHGGRSRTARCRGIGRPDGTDHDRHCGTPLPRGGGSGAGDRRGCRRGWWRAAGGPGLRCSARSTSLGPARRSAVTGLAAASSSARRWTMAVMPIVALVAVVRGGTACARDAAVGQGRHGDRVPGLAAGGGAGVTRDALRWGILGTASIARRRVIPALQASARNAPVAIASRDVSRASRIAREKRIPVSGVAR